jgi:hypothetical protein
MYEAGSQSLNPVPGSPPSERIVIPKEDAYAKIALLLAFFSLMAGPLTGVPSIWLAAQAKRRILSSGGRLVGMEKAQLAIKIAGILTFVFIGVLLLALRS